MLKIAWRNNYAHHLPDGHRFPMAKYELIPEQLLYEGTVTDANFFVPEPITEAEILEVHDAEYYRRLSNLELSRAEERKSGFPHSAALIDRERCIMEGTRMASEYALQYGAAMNIAGGTHHAYTNRAEGFCLLNDIALSANYLLKQATISKVLVVDLDVHQGNGTAQIFAENPAVFTFSMHGAKNYPMHKEQSDLDIGVPDGITDKDYLKLLKNTLPRLMDEVAPDFVLYQCGVDILESDKLGRLGVSRDGCKERDRYVLQTCKDHEIPICCSMGGGYSTDIKDIVEAHANTFRLAQEIFF